MTRSADLATAKSELRRHARAARAAMSVTQLDSSRAGVRTVLLARMDSDCTAGRPWRRVFAYEALPDEPASAELLRAMADRGATIYVPQLCPDLDLDWCQWPGATPSGRDVVAEATVVLVPALAVDPTGARLGRGGGSYDRALARKGPTTPVVALLHPDELLTWVPAQDWDRPVSAVVTARGWFDVKPIDGRSSEVNDDPHPPTAGRSTG